MLTKKLYEQATGRSQKSNIIAYQIRQSFRPGEITAEEANRIGYELASRFLKGKHAFIVATHTDREHIHNHIIYNSTTLDASFRFAVRPPSSNGFIELRRQRTLNPVNGASACQKATEKSVRSSVFASKS